MAKEEFIIKYFYLFLSLCMPIIIFMFLRIVLKIWTKYRDDGFKEYSYKNNDIAKRIKFSFKYLLIILFPLMLIVLLNIINFIHLLNCFNELEYNTLDIIISIILDIILIIIQGLCYRRIVKYDNYLAICKKYNIVYEKLELEILTIIEILYFNFSFVIFFIDII